MDRLVPIRAINRGIAVLSAINRDGPISMMRIARSADVPYPTACRIVQTLIEEGYVEREPARKRYRVTARSLRLSAGFRSEDRLVPAARPPMEALCRAVGWPLSLATRVGTRMMVRLSTHTMTPLTISNYYPGYTLPIAECATGKVHLACCDPAEQAVVRDAWLTTDTASARLGLALLDDTATLADIRERGYALQHRNAYNAEPGRTSSVAVPVHDAGGRFCAALALIHYAEAMAPEEAAARYLADLRATAAAIGAALTDVPR